MICLEIYINHSQKNNKRTIILQNLHQNLDRFFLFIKKERP
jgi:hypothetical protein